MSIIYLYIKTHNQTGLKYLGRTKHNPLRYKGSGVYWTRHIKIHGYDVSTQIIGTYTNEEDFKKASKYYSKLFNIVESEEWANLIPEEGQVGPGVYRGYKQSKEHILKRTQSIESRIKHSNDTKNRMWITNDNEDRYINKNSIIPEGFRKGRKQFSQEWIENTKGPRGPLGYKRKSHKKVA